MRVEWSLCSSASAELLAMPHAQTPAWSTMGGYSRQGWEVTSLGSDLFYALTELWECQMSNPI